ncbi:MAG: HAD family hydrolase [Comamonadaceae bacterium]|nr:HAD family hydrolase [Comamonadaceae bacterium]
MLWDVDGTLAETEDQGHRVAFNLGVQGRRPELALGQRAVRRPAEGHRRQGAPDAPWWQRIDAAAAAGPEAARFIAELHERKTAVYVDLLARRAIKLRPGVSSVLDAAHAAGLRQAIATTTTPANVTQLIDVTLGGRGHRVFEVIGAGDAVPAQEAGPRHLPVGARAPEAAGRIECLAIEDSAMGVEAAVAAGVPVLLARSRYTGTAVIPGTVADLPSLEGVRIEDIQRWHATAVASACPASEPTGA